MLPRVFPSGLTVEYVRDSMYLYVYGFQSGRVCERVCFAEVERKQQDKWMWHQHFLMQHHGWIRCVCVTHFHIYYFAYEAELHLYG